MAADYGMGWGDVHPGPVSRAARAGYGPCRRGRSIGESASHNFTRGTNPVDLRFADWRPGNPPDIQEPS